MVTAKTTNLWVSNEGVRMRKQGRAGLEGLLAACLPLLTFRPSFSLMSNLPALTPTDCTIALGSTLTPSVKANETWGWACEPTTLTTDERHPPQNQDSSAHGRPWRATGTHTHSSFPALPGICCIRFITPTWSQLTGEWWKLFTWQPVRLMYRGFPKKQTLPVLTNSRQEWEHMERVSLPRRTFSMVQLLRYSGRTFPIFPFSGKSWITSVPEARAGKKKQSR